MLVFTFSLFFMLILFYSLFFDLGVASTRFSESFSQLSYLVKSLAASKYFSPFLYVLFFVLLAANVPGNIPLYPSSTIFYSFCFSVSFLFWISLMGCVGRSQLKPFLAHLLPTGAPVSVMFALPLVELFSHIIRPITLVVRISTNLAAGHIMKLILSYFSLLSSMVAPGIFFFLFLIFTLELVISFLQAYIFVSLLKQYFEETF